MQLNRRRYLGACGLATVAGIAGCLGGGDGGADGSSQSGDSGGSDGSGDTGGGATTGDRGTVTTQSGTTQSGTTRSGTTTQSGTTPIEGTLDGWPMAEHDARRSRYASDERVPTGGVTERWRIDRETNQGRFGDVVVSSGRAYFVSIESTDAGGTKRGTVHAVDAATGSEAWRVTLRNRVAPGNETPLVSGDRVVVADDGKKDNVYALSADDGSEVWRKRFAETRGTPVQAGERVLVVARQDLVSLAPADGSVAWRMKDPPSDFIRRGPVVLGDTAYIASMDADTTVHAVVLSDGSTRWTATVPKSSGLMGLAAGDSTVYATYRSGELFALDAADGATRWQYATGKTAIPPVVTDDGVYVAASGESAATVYALATDGTEQWTRTLEGVSWAQPVAAGDTLVVGTRDATPYEKPRGGSVTALSTADGSTRWEAPIEKRGMGQPTVVDGVVFVPGSIQQSEERYLNSLITLTAPP